MKRTNTPILQTLALSALTLAGVKTQAQYTPPPPPQPQQQIQEQQEGQQLQQQQQAPANGQDVEAHGQNRENNTR